MNEHLIPVTPEQLVRLPDGIRLAFISPDGRVLAEGRLLGGGSGCQARRIYVESGSFGAYEMHVLRQHNGAWHLDLSDTLTRAAVAAVFVAHTMGPHDSVRDPIGHSACCAAVWWPTRFDWRLTLDEITHHVARLARAALGSADGTVTG